MGHAENNEGMIAVGMSLDRIHVDDEFDNADRERIVHASQLVGLISRNAIAYTLTTGITLCSRV